MLDSQFRSPFQAIFFHPLAKLLTRLGLRPNQITIAAIVFGLIAASALALDHRILALAMLALSGILDAVDGTMARLLKQSSDRGCVLDIFGDRLVEVFIVVGLYWHEPSSRGWSTLLLLASFYLCVTSFLLSGIFEKNHSHKSFHYSPGIIERGETFVFFFVVIIFDDIFNYAAPVFASLVILTSLIRLTELIKLVSRTTCATASQQNLDALHQATTQTKDQATEQ